ncbi:hypothetical protein K488DRAFT_89188 [Vararia minispora EC-137]|uniref:Uncharacterized protein n=1 Tax=Vararia minispora EC-137 TaxID=1314806 RepID=A0ACB8QBB3_9AGAM|nr:hypothetical protein K488DRAFT_89188 [Vararia minispora EC-137]
MANNYDQQTYNPAAEQRFDNDEYRPPHSGSDVVERVGNVPRGGALESGLDAEREDAAAAESEATGRLSKGEARGLMSDLRDEERDVRGGLRGNRVDAYQQERAVDEQVDRAVNQDEGMY